MVNSGLAPSVPNTLYLSSNEFVAASRASFADPHIHSISSQSTGDDALRPCSSCAAQCRCHSSQFHTIMSATGTCRSCRHPFRDLGVQMFESCFVSPSFSDVARSRCPKRLPGFSTSRGGFHPLSLARCNLGILETPT